MVFIVKLKSLWLFLNFRSVSEKLYDIYETSSLLSSFHAYLGSIDQLTPGYHGGCSSPLNTYDIYKSFTLLNHLYLNLLKYLPKLFI